MFGNVARDDFEWVYSDQPHSARRGLMLKKYPIIKKYMCVDPHLKYVVSAMVATQVLMAYTLQDSSWWTIVFWAYVVGGTINHSLTLAIHDIGHNTAYGNGKNSYKNRYFGFVANLPLGVPYSVTFKKYHIDHHRYLAGDQLDTDLPTEWEGRFFTNSPLKLLWLILNPAFYAFRPMIIRPKKPTHYELKNMMAQIIFNMWIYQSFGGKALSYLLIGTALALGVHPTAGHFIAEHYMFCKGQDTYSYYGSLNYILFNVGYHMEHHDFPFINSSSLPMISKIAPEYYNELPQLKSYLLVLKDFIFDPKIGPFARVTRKFDESGKIVKSKDPDFPDYTDEDARLGRNASYSSPSRDFENNNDKISTNIILNKYLHAY